MLPGKKEVLWTEWTFKWLVTPQIVNIKYICSETTVYQTHIYKTVSVTFPVRGWRVQNCPTVTTLHVYGGQCQGFRIDEQQFCGSILWQIHHECGLSRHTDRTVTRWGGAATSTSVGKEWLYGCCIRSVTSVNLPCASAGVIFCPQQGAAKTWCQGKLDL